MRFKNDLTAADVWSLFDYNPETGEFRYKIRKGGRASVGKLAGHFDGRYFRIEINGRTYQASRIAWLWYTGEWPKEEIDHKDGNTCNNRFLNLRPASRADNCQNRGIHRNNTSGVKGVSFYKRNGKWRCRIAVNNKAIHLGYFVTIEEASEAYANAAREHFGDFART